MATDPRSKSRGLRTRVKTARGRKTSSTRWLARQLNDPYVAEAKRLGYRSRSAFKLKEIAGKYNVLKNARTIVDLGAAPGGWCQVLRSITPKAKILAVDLQQMEPLEGVTFICGDFLEDETYEAILKQTSKGVDAVISDMANAATGHRQTDHMRTMALAEAAFDFACLALNPGGVFLTKALTGGTEKELLDAIKQRFEKVRHVKPPSSRADSRELFVLAHGFKGKST